jgi:glycosyltransferase involved in cell wall biosynthesis
MVDRSTTPGADELVSIIVPTRDRAALLNDSLSSLARLACEAKLEFIVVDNASTDETASVIEGWRQRDDRFRPMHEPRLGRSQAMNAGASFARGRLLLFTDDDVIADPEWAEALRQCLSARSSEIVVAGGPILPIAEGLGPWPQWLPPGALADLGALDWGPAERALGRHEHLWGANMAVSAETFARVGPWDETVGRRGDHRGTYEDIEYQRRIRAAGGSVVFCPAAKIHHRIDPLEVSARRIVSAAFSRGRNEFWSTHDLRTSTVDAEPRRHGLVWNFLTWARHALALRVGISRDRVERARAAAFSAGWAMERAPGRSGSDSWKALAQRASWTSSRVILRAIPAPIAAHDPADRS